MSALLAFAAAASGTPTIAPQVFVSAKAITFHSPRGAFICPLPKDWIGSDHGTTLFLERPRSCAAQGYPSSERNYRDSSAVRRIGVFYWYWMSEDEPVYECHQRGSIFWMGKNRPLCLIRQGETLKFWSQARFFADTESAISISLVTRPTSKASDLKRFRSWATTVRACRIHDKDTKGTPYTYGPAPDCPKAGVFF